MSKKLQKVLVPVLLIVFVFCMGSLSAAAVSYPDLSQYSDSELETLRDRIDQELSSRQKKSSAEVYKVGKAATYDRVSYTLVSVTEDKGDGVFFKPGTGNVYLKCQFLIENNSKETISFNMWTLGMEAYADDMAAEYDVWQTDLSGDVAPGKKMKGNVVFEAPKNWKELEIHYNVGSFWDAHELVFTATNK